MSLTPALTGTATALPLPNTAPTPAAGELVRAEDIQEAVQALLNQDRSLEAHLSAAVASRSVTRVQQAFFASTDLSVWTVNQYGDAEQQTNDTLNYATCPLLLPHGATLTQVYVRVLPSAGHGGLPGTMPVVSVIRHAMPAHTSLGSATDNSANVGAYEAVHNISVSGLSVSVDRSLYRYSVRLAGESGANFVAGMQAFAVVCTYTITSYDSD